MKDFEQLITFIKSKGIEDAEILTSIKDHSEHLRSVIKGANDEAKNHRIQYDELSKKLDEVVAKTGNKSIDDLSSGISEKDLTIKKLQDQFKEISDKMNMIEQEKQKSIAEVNERKLIDALKSTLLEKGVKKEKNLSLVSNLLKSSFKVDSEGEFVNTEGKKVSDVIDHYLHDNEILIDSPLDKGGVGSRSALDSAKNSATGLAQFDTNKKFLNAIVEIRKNKQKV